MEIFLKEEIEVEVEIVSCKRSGKVIVIMLGNEKVKRVIMENNRKLKGKDIYIENDLSWEERRVQVRIGRWMKKEKEKGKIVKIGFARVMIEGVWKKWEEIEAEEREKERKERVSGEEVRNIEDREEVGIRETEKNGNASRGLWSDFVTEKSGSKVAHNCLFFEKNDRYRVPLSQFRTRNVIDYLRTPPFPNVLARVKI